MIRSIAKLCAAALCGCATTTTPQIAFNDKASQASVDQYVAQAGRIAGDDLKQLMSICQPQPAVRASGPAMEAGLRRLLALPAAEPGQAFDNLYFLGTSWVSAWVVKTSQGLILLDALNTEKDAREIIEPSMVKMGLDPAQIKYIVVSHAHGDHYGGAPYLAQKYKARVVASEADWQQMTGTLEFPSPLFGPPPQRDMSVNDGDKLTLGDTTLTFYVTPGHTLGTLTTVFDVKSGGQPHRALLWGGTSFNFGKDLPRLESYVKATERMRSVAKSQGIDVMISNHSGFDNAVAKLKANKDGGGKGPNAFVIGEPAVERSLEVMGTCARAQRDRFLM